MIQVYSNMGEQPSKTEGRSLETSYRDLSTSGENSLVSQAKPASIHLLLTLTCGFHRRQVFIVCFYNEHIFIYRALISCLGQHPPCHCSVTQSCPTLCDPMDYSMPGFPVHYGMSLSKLRELVMDMLIIETYNKHSPSVKATG